MVAYDDATLVEDFDRLSLDGLRAALPPASAPPPLIPPRLLRYRVSTSTGGVVEEELSDVNLELPRIDYRERNTRPYRYVYGVGARGDDGAPNFLDQLVKVDVESGEAQTWFEPGSYPGEPVFVPVPAGQREEDDGVLLSVVLDGRGASSYLLVLEAGSLNELGRARVPHHIPFGFHGDYFG